YRKRLHIHSHQHSQAASEHIHFHVHNPDDAHESVEFAPHVHAHTAFWVGTLHGFAGTAHLVGILPSLALPTSHETAGYLSAFALGTLLAMTGFAAAIGRLTPQRGERGMRGYAYALAGTSGLCLLTGLAWIILPLAGVELP
ncbi:MAG TPA: hypothetical protein VL860_02830, partial [Planctomycetota bacterium]|nr:hypothetical protein [Planctomycetota bacterium]